MHVAAVGGLGGVVVSSYEAIGSLFARLEQTDSIEAVVTDAVRLACETAGCAASAVVFAAAAGLHDGYWFSHDPHGVLEDPTNDPKTPAAHALQSFPLQLDIGRTRGRKDAVCVPIVCAGRNLGQLVLIPPEGVREEETRSQIIGIALVLGVLLAAMENSATRSMSNVLAHGVFRARVASELARVQRNDDELSVLHLKVAATNEFAPDGSTHPWAAAALLGEELAACLRKCDVVGIIGPNHLAVLLADTGQLGARIAARRIHQLTGSSEQGSSSMSDLGVVVDAWCLRSSPGAGRATEDYCDVWDWQSPACHAPLPAGAGR